MIEKNLRAVWPPLALAAVIWYIIFGLRAFNFWTSMGVAAGLLSIWAISAGGPPFTRTEWNRRTAWQGIWSAAALYGIFWLGSYLSQVLFAFAGEQIGFIYGNRTAAPLPVIALLLALIIGPGEEIFWRGFVQRRFAARWGGAPGWLLGALVYAGVHAWSLNFMLVMAALVGGLFWGWIFLRTRSIVPGIISHVLWDLLAFIIIPLV